MKSPTVRVSAAAVLVIACLVVLFPGAGAVTVAGVLQKIEQIQAFAYKTRTVTQDAPGADKTSQGTVLVSHEYGMRIDQVTTDGTSGEASQQQTFFLPLEKAFVMIDHGRKEYARAEYDDATLEAIQAEKRDPRAVVKRLLNCRCKELGESSLGGVKVQGFETTDPAYASDGQKNVRATLWVDVDTWLPVRLETEMEIRDGLRMKAVESDFQWGVAVSPDDFKPQIPDGFTPHQMSGWTVPSASERGFIEALKLVADLTGHYPREVNSSSLAQISQEMGRAITEGNTPTARQWQEQIKTAGSREAAVRMGQDRMMKLLSLTTFNRILTQQQKEPLYHGDVVTPSDAALPLMRWKVSDTEYRVIFGDLHAATVGAPALADLEKALPR